MTEQRNDDGVEPDAWLTNKIFGHPVTAHSKSVHPLPEVDEKDIEPLFAVSTIQEQINSLKERIESDRTRVQENSEGVNESYHKHMNEFNRQIQILEDLKEVFSSDE